MKKLIFSFILLFAIVSAKTIAQTVQVNDHRTGCTISLWATGLYIDEDYYQDQCNTDHESTRQALNASFPFSITLGGPGQYKLIGVSLYDAASGGSKLATAYTSESRCSPTELTFDCGGGTATLEYAGSYVFEVLD